MSYMYRSTLTTNDKIKKIYLKPEHAQGHFPLHLTFVLHFAKQGLS